SVTSAGAVRTTPARSNPELQRVKCSGGQQLLGVVGRVGRVGRVGEQVLVHRGDLVGPAHERLVSRDVVAAEGEVEAIVVAGFGGRTAPLDQVVQRADLGRGLRVDVDPGGRETAV